MGKVHKLRLRSDLFIKNLDNIKKEAVHLSPNLVDLNKSQLKDEHENALDQPITPAYSASYAVQKGFSTPDLYYSGHLFSTMRLFASQKTFKIMGFTDYVKKLTVKYGDNFFGIAKSKTDEAKAITTKAIATRYRKEVFK